MWAGERHQRIQRLLQRLKQVSAETLARELRVSRETIRRDLLELEKTGVLRRVHGGALVPDPQAEAPFANRMNVRRREKEAIARALPQLVRSGQSCFLGAGSTTVLMAAGQLAKTANLTAITNSVEIANTMADVHQGEDAVLLGGRVNGSMPGTYGELTLSEIARFHVDAVVLSPVGIDASQGATDFSFPEAEIARAMIANSGRVILLADSSKLGVVSRVQICGCARIDVLVTDSGASKLVLRALRAAGVKKTVIARV